MPPNIPVGDYFAKVNIVVRPQLYQALTTCTLLCCLQLVDPKSGAETPVVISEDDGIRGSTTLDSLGQLRAVFKVDGTTTAGNSSQVGSRRAWPTGIKD